VVAVNLRDLDIMSETYVVFEGIRRSSWLISRNRLNCGRASPKTAKYELSQIYKQQSEY